MNSTPNFWLAGYENVALRKRLAYFRPWIEDRTVSLFGDDSVAAQYIQALASAVSDENPDLVFAPGVSSDALSEAHSKAQLARCAFVGWSNDESAELQTERIIQSNEWPFVITNDSKARGTSIWFSAGNQSKISHSAVGIAIPTHTHARAALEAVAAFAAEYPGETRFAIVTNGVSKAAVEELKKAISFDKGHIELIAFEENRGYGKGCNAGLQALFGHEDLDYIAVCNDDVLPGTDCLYELVHALQELKNLGHNPGAIGPVSNEINGAQQVDIGVFGDPRAMRSLAGEYWAQNPSAANQTLQLRGLLMLFTRECLETVGGFDPRFGIGNFEDDDHNLRTRLAGFTLWIAAGAFLFHHGSSTFKSLKIDYEANILRNAESMMRKWQLERLEDWISLDSSTVEVYQPFTTDLESGPTVRINGETVDLLNQASDIEFAAWVMGQPPTKTPEGRKAMVELLTKVEA